jgi:hypothetical protein
LRLAYLVMAGVIVAALLLVAWRDASRSAEAPGAHGPVGQAP